jgi:hypothetical protein
MGKNMSLVELHEYIENNSHKIADVHKELEEIQVGFNSAYVEWKAEHDASLERLVESVVQQMDNIGSDLEARIKDRMIEERRVIAARMKELEVELIPQAMQEADGVLGEGQKLVQELRELNPELNDREERLKSKRIQLEEELNRLNKTIQKRSRGLGVAIHFIEITRLDRQRQQVIGKLKALQEDLKEVRETWHIADTTAMSEKQDLQGQWQQLTLKRLHLEGELDFLQEKGDREALALKRAIRHELDNLKEPIACPDPALKVQMDEMVQLNIQTDDYQAAFGPLSGVISLLEGIIEGLRRFNESIQGLIDQQKMHSAYLPMLDVNIPDKVINFNSGWDALRKSVQDEASISSEPVDFLAKVQPLMADDLNEARIQSMFESLGEALNHATESWRA